MFNRWRQITGPFAPSVAFFLFFILLFTLDRALLLFFFHNDLHHFSGTAQVFPVGLRIDIIFLSAVLFIPVIFLFIFPKHWVNKMRYVLAGFLTLIAVLVIVLEISSFPFMQEYGNRPDQVFFQYFTHPSEVLSTIWAEQQWLLIISFLFTIGLIIFFWYFTLILLREYAAWHWKLRLVWLPIVIIGLTIGARSGIGMATPNPSLAAFSNNHIANQIALNASYSLLFAVYRHTENKMQSEELYGQLPRAEMFARIKQQMFVNDELFTRQPTPTSHKQHPQAKQTVPYNLVIILMESLGAEFVASLGGKPLTPNLERLSQQGLYFTQMHAIGTRTSRGIEAMVSGFPPTTQSGSILKLPLSQKNFFTVAGLLKTHGYHSSFIYAGEGHFDNMAGFLLGNGFDDMIDLDDFPSEVEQTTWGIADEDLLIFANRYLSQQKAPFLSLILTISNHKPYDIPSGKIKLYEHPIQTKNNSAKYADYAIGRFFDLAKQEHYFSNTIFVLVADHYMQVNGKQLVPIHQFKIPAILLGPNIPVMQYKKIASQIDILPTALRFLGIELEHPMIGRDVLAIPAETPGRALMQYGDNNAYLMENKLVIHQPNKPPLQFIYDGKKMQATDNQPELIKNALAHILYPSVVYHEQTYQTNENAKEWTTR